MPSSGIVGRRARSMEFGAHYTLMSHGINLHVTLDAPTQVLIARLSSLLIGKKANQQKNSEDLCPHAYQMCNNIVVELKMVSSTSVACARECTFVTIYRLN